jgi:hypothetical protein
MTSKWFIAFGQNFLLSDLFVLDWQSFPPIKLRVTRDIAFGHATLIDWVGENSFNLVGKKNLFLTKSECIENWECCGAGAPFPFPSLFNGVFTEVTDRDQREGFSGVLTSIVAQTMVSLLLLLFFYFFLGWMSGRIKTTYFKNLLNFIKLEIELFWNLQGMIEVSLALLR